MRIFRIAVFAAALAAAVFVGSRFWGKSPAAHAAAGCDATSLNSSYGFIQSGYAYDSQGYPYVLGGTGRITGDGNGALTGFDTLNYDGTVYRRTFTGTYTVNADCSGKVILTLSDKTMLNGDILIVNDGKEVLYNDTDTDFIYYGRWSRLSQATAAQ